MEKCCLELLQSHAYLCHQLFYLATFGWPTAKIYNAMNHWNALFVFHTVPFFVHFIFKCFILNFLAQHRAILILHLKWNIVTKSSKYGVSSWKASILPMSYSKYKSLSWYHLHATYPCISDWLGTRDYSNQ